jgi:very-short-patch-repair endonuclease
MENEHKIVDIVKLEYGEIINIIKQNVEPYSLYNCQGISKILKMKNIRGCVIDYDITEKQLIKTITNGGIQKLGYLTFKGLNRLLMSSRSCEAIKFISLLGVVVVRKHYPIETDILSNIIEVFKNEQIERQHTCDKYRIDLYFTEYKIAVECDETYHKYNKLKDEERETFIKNNLDCLFIHFNPYETDFSILTLFNKIHLEIITKIKKNL